MQPATIGASVRLQGVHTNHPRHHARTDIGHAPRSRDCSPHLREQAWSALCEAGFAHVRRKQLHARPGFQAPRIDTVEMHRHEERNRHRHRHGPGWAGWWVDAATYDLRQSFPCSEATVSRHCWVRSHLSSSVLQRHFSEAAPRYKGEQEKSYEGLSPCVMKSLPRVFRRSVVGGGGVDVDSRPDKIRAMMSLLPPSHLRAPSPELSLL